MHRTLERITKANAAIGLGFGAVFTIVGVALLASAASEIEEHHTAK